MTLRDDPRCYSLQKELTEAVSAGDNSAAAAALGKGANASGSYEQYMSPLNIASDHGDIKMMTLLLDAGADVNKDDKGLGATPLAFAVHNKRTESVRLLIKRGADVCYYDPIQDAREGGQQDVIDLLTAAGADRCPPSQRERSNATQIQQCAPCKPALQLCKLTKLLSKLTKPGVS
jgi:hypothetical protein